MTGLHNLGAYELMLILHELHKAGYQKLRWLSYMAPSGLSLRCHITTQDHICANREIVNGCGNREIWSASVGVLTTGEDINPLVRIFMEENPRLLEIGKGQDADYAEWFDKLLKLASEGEMPLFYGEHWALPMGWIKAGRHTVSAPPARLRLISWNIDGIKAHFEALKGLVENYSPEIVCLQKVKDIKDSPEFEIEGYRRECSSGPYAGVATYVKTCIACESDKPKNPELVGHLLKTEVRYPAFTLYNIYTPYSNPGIDGAVERRRKFDGSLRRIVCETPDRQILCGDMNIVVSQLDCWDGRYKRKQANFHDWERRNFLELMKAGRLIDTFRTVNPLSREYTYFFRNDADVRAGNRGYRIDYFLASRSLEPQIVSAGIIKECTVSTNNPILLEIEY